VKQVEELTVDLKAAKGDVRKLTDEIVKLQSVIVNE